MDEKARARIAADRSDIAQCFYRLARALDRLDQDALRALFADDAHVELGVFHKGGADGFVPVAMGFMRSMERTQHTIGNILIEFTGDEAAAEAHVHAQHLMTGETGEAEELLVGARYLTKFRRTDAGWRIAQHSEVMDWAVKRAIGSWFAENGELPKGRRDEGDPSYALFASLKSR